MLLDFFLATFTIIYCSIHSFIQCFDSYVVGGFSCFLFVCFFLSFLYCVCYVMGKISIFLQFGCQKIVFKMETVEQGQKS